MGRCTALRGARPAWRRRGMSFMVAQAAAGASTGHGVFPAPGAALALGVAPSRHCAAHCSAAGSLQAGLLCACTKAVCMPPCHTTAMPMPQPASW